MKLRLFNHKLESNRQLVAIILLLNLTLCLVVAAEWWSLSGLSLWPALVILLVVAASGGLIWQLWHTPLRWQADTMGAESQRQRLLALINSLADAVMAIDTSQRVTLYNGAALDLLNLHTDLLGRAVDSLLPLVTEHNTVVHWQDLIRQPGIVKREDLIYITGTGTRVNLDISLAPVHNLSRTGPESEGYILVVRDITDAKSLEQQRNEFISVVSHELRTPLAIAEANISTALLPKFGRINAQARELLGQAYHNIIFLADLIKDLTTLARAEQNILPIDLQPLDATALLGSLSRDYAAEASAKKLKLAVEVPNHLPKLLTNEYRIHEVLQNFITNAITYTQKGQVTLGAEMSKKHKGGLIFSVKDTGPGIAARDKKHIFEKFYRAPEAKKHYAAGTGLGLYIAERLAERLDAKLWYTSRLGHGACFYLEVPPYNKDQF